MSAKQVVERVEGVQVVARGAPCQAAEGEDEGCLGPCEGMAPSRSGPSGGGRRSLRGSVEEGNGVVAAAATVQLCAVVSATHLAFTG